MNHPEDAIAAIIILNELLSENEEEEVPLKKKRIWSKNKLLKNEEFSNESLLVKLKEHEPQREDYRSYLNIGEETFGKLLNLIKHRITKEDTVMREAVSAEVRLAITLRYLETGNSFADLKNCTSVSAQLIGNIVVETCDAINEELNNYIKLPELPEEWLIEADKFYAKSKFPHCLGALGAKHIKIKKPPHTNREYLNYMKSFSLPLLAIANANSEFLMVDVDDQARFSDGEIFSRTEFFRKLEGKQLNLPEAYPVFGETIIPYVFVSDDAVSLHSNIMKPYADNSLSYSQSLFNKRLCSAREQVENAFLILASRFRILNTTIALVPEKAKKVILSCCYLHNFLKKEKVSTDADSNTIAKDIADNPLLNLAATFTGKPPPEAEAVRYVLSETVYCLDNIPT